MTDPEYSYIKGRGWVLQTKTIIKVPRTGRQFTLEVKKPEPGELFFNIGKTPVIGEWMTEDGLPGQASIEHAVRYDGDFAPFTRFGSMHREDSYYVVVTEVA